MLLNATALLAVIGLLIALLWAWVWSGVFASSRRVAMRMDMRGGSASAELNRVVWPLMPLLSLRLVCDCRPRGSRGSRRRHLGSCALLLGLFGVMVVVAIQSLVPGGTARVGTTRGGWHVATTWQPGCSRARAGRGRGDLTGFMP